jgi:hypothetical protein
VLRPTVHEVLRLDLVAAATGLANASCRADVSCRRFGQGRANPLPRRWRHT